MDMFAGASPIKIKISLGMLQDKEVIQALSALLTAMGKAQEVINARLEQEMRQTMLNRPLRPFGG